MKRIHHVEIVVFEDKVSDNGEVVDHEVVFEEQIGEDIEVGDTVTYEDVIAELLLGMTMEEVLEDHETLEKAVYTHFKS